MSTGRRVEGNVDKDDFFDVPMHTSHKTSTFTMSTKSISIDRNTAGDFQSPCPSGRKVEPRKGCDMDRGDILTLPTTSSDSEPDTESRIKKKTNSPRSSRHSQRSAKSVKSSSTRSKTGSGGSYSSSNSDSETNTYSNSDSCNNGDVQDSGRRALSPHKSSETKSHSRHSRERRAMGDSTTAQSHKQAWCTDTGAAPQQTVERPKTAHHRKVNSHDSSSGTRSCSSDSRSRSHSRSHSHDNSSYSRSGSESSSCSSLTSSESDASDVTDVSPLNSPTHKISTPDMRRWEQCQLGSKPPRSPANKGGYSQRSRPSSATSTLDSCCENVNFLQANSDRMDLKFLMQAVMEMEREKASSRDPHVFFQPGGSKNTKQLSDSRHNYSFPNDKVRDIDTENQRLMHQILKYTAKKKAGPKSETSQRTEERVVNKRQTTTTSVSHLTPSAINRMRDQRRIERDNQALLKRLQKTRPTRTLQRDGLLDDYNKQLLAGLSVAACHPPVKATRTKLRSGSATASIYTNSATRLHSDFGSTPSTRRPQSATLATKPSPDKRRRPLSATTRPQSGKLQGKVRPLSATVSRKATRQRPVQPAWEPGW